MLVRSERSERVQPFLQCFAMVELVFSFLDSFSSLPFHRGIVDQRGASRREGSCNLFHARSSNSSHVSAEPSHRRIAD